MCTVTYLPTSDTTFILTSSRDERIARKPALFPVYKHTPFHAKVLFPQDGDKGGTWIASSSTLTVCLLNGAFENHVPEPPYRLSRGLVVVSVFDYASVDEFIHAYNFQGIEPFTMIMVQHASTVILTELRWDGKEKHISKTNSQQPYIWSSVTLYDRQMIEERTLWFSQWLQEKAFNVESIRGFHQSGGKGTDTSYNIRMNRPGLVSTVSITSVEVEISLLRMYYEDLATNTLAQQTFRRLAYPQII
ncbi:NRDE family protein [Rhodocytophaga aerolata]|uniref:NRDE family protein n=1 Tax=Rhodocytophaga aerolata TaxID=455078 RepID=A0ABT8R8X0_9BACT|nr:NRDE family protein [Rhodocytophaga aerolata]MDO1448530.1 NRDE family protein [Rhodocytophaga aerolata]